MSKNHWEQALYKGKNHRNENLEYNYLNSSWKIDQVKCIFEILDNKFPNLFNRESKILEIGCNLAKNLREFNSRYKSTCYGFDINKEAIDKCKEYFNSKDNFFCEDLRETNGLSNYPDNFFDFGISTGFLMHLETGDDKDRLVKEFFRVCKNGLILELTCKTGFQHNVMEPNEYVLSYDNYTRYNDQIELVDIYDKQYGIWTFNKND
jgi:SAM-dependent methyltransferase